MPHCVLEGGGSILDLVAPRGLTLLVALHGSLIGINQPARLALVPALVRPGDLRQAIALNSVTFNLARAFGPAVAGWVVAAFGAGVAFISYRIRRRFGGFRL